MPEVLSACVEIKVRDPAASGTVPGPGPASAVGTRSATTTRNEATRARTVTIGRTAGRNMPEVFGLRLTWRIREARRRVAQSSVEDAVGFHRAMRIAAIRRYV